MRIKMIAALALTALAAMPALAQTTTGAAQTNQTGTTTTTKGSFNATGNAVGSSASGFSSTLNTPSGAAVEFNSIGAGSTQVTITPFSVTSTSAHAGSFQAQAFNGGSLQATDQTFGQSNGSILFNAAGDAHTTSFTAHTDFAFGPANDTTVVDQPTDVGEMPN